jgi:hypothetical protein
MRHGMETTSPMQDNSLLYPSLSVEIIPTTSRSMLYKMMLTTLILFTMFNIFYLYYISQYDALNKSENLTVIDYLEEPVDVIIFGDSVVNSAINPHQIEAETGLTAVNLARNAEWVYYNDVWMLERYIEKFGPPKYIIMGHVYRLPPHRFDPMVQLGSISHPYGFSWYSKYLHPNLTLDDKLNIITRRLFPLYFRKETTYTIIENLLFLHNPIPPSKLNSVLESKGFNSSHTTIDIEYVEADAMSDPINKDYQFITDNLRVIDIFLDIIDTYRIQTYVFVTPVNRILGSRKPFQPATYTQREFWHMKSLEYDMLHFNPEIPLFESEHMYNSDHLNIYGSEIYTQYLIDWIWGDYVPSTLDQIFEKGDD